MANILEFYEEISKINLDCSLINSFNKIYLDSKNKNISMREACYIYSFKKIESVVQKKKVF